MTEFSLKMNQQEIALPVKITLTSKNLKRQIEENALEFQNEVTKLNKCIDENNKKTLNLINQALSENNQRWEECFVQLENLVKSK